MNAMNAKMPRHRSTPLAPPAAAAAPQVTVHVARLVLDASATLPGLAGATDLQPQAVAAALQQALGAQLAGQVPAVNRATPLDHLASAVATQVQPTLRQGGPA
jgi:hypothetical protein